MQLLLLKAGATSDVIFVCGIQRTHPVHTGRSICLSMILPTLRTYYQKKTWHTSIFAVPVSPYSIKICSE
jgi:hypothetical protein